MPLHPDEAFYATLDSKLDWLSGFTWPNRLKKLGLEVGDRDFVAFRFYQQLEEMKIDMRPLQSAASAASHWTELPVDSEDPDGPGGEDHAFASEIPDSFLHISETTVVAVTPFDAGELDDAAELDVSSSFDKVIAELAMLEQGYLAATKEITYRSITRRSAYPFCLYSLWVDGEESWQQSSLFWVNMRPALVSDREALDSDSVERMKISWIRTRQSDPWQRYVLASLDAQRALDWDGDFAQCVSRAYTAMEILLDTVWTCMAWEEITYQVNPGCQATIETVKSWFSIKSSLDTRLARCFQGRLIGWDTENVKTPAHWFRYGVAKLRHRVIHAGYIPTESEAQYSLDLCKELEDYMKGLLVRDVNRTLHPRTALMWMGIPGIQRRGKFKGKIKRLTEVDDEDNWVDSFAAFRHQIDRELGYLDIVLPI